MKVIDNGSVPLCNAEVLAHLNSLGAKIEADGRLNQVPGNLTAIVRDATTYLRIPTQPTSRQRDGRFTPASIAALTTALKAKPWRLLDAEVLQVLNHGPTDGEEVAMLLEDADLRFSSEQLERIAEIVVDALEVKSLTEVGAARVEVVGKGQADGGARGL